MTLQINLNLLADNNGVAGEPLSRDRIAANDSFFVEIEVADLRDNAAGVIGLTLDIEWDVFVLEALDAEITNKLPFNPQGIADRNLVSINERGLIRDFGAGAIPNFDRGEAVGINELERFALIHFQGEKIADATPLTVSISDPRDVAFADGTSFDSDDVEIEAQTIEVTPENNAPRLVNRISDLTTPEDSEFSFTVPDDTFRDIESDRLTYSAMLNGSRDLPDWLSFDSETRTFSGTPDNGDVGTVELKVRATDNGGKSANDRFFLTVENTNDPPRLINPIEDRVTSEDSEFSFTVPDNTFRDIDRGDRLTYSAFLNSSDNLPDWLNFDSETRTFSGTPDNDDLGRLELKVRATDNDGKTANDRFTLTIENVDDPPVVRNRIADLEVDEDSEDTAIDISNVFGDVDNDNEAIVKTVSANSNEDLVTATINGDNLTLDYQENRSGQAEITIEGESNGKTVTDTFEVTVNSVDDLPVVRNPLNDLEVNENAAAQIIDLSNVFSDADGDAIPLNVRTNDNDLVAPILDGTDLTLNFLEDRFGSAEITIEATANGQTVLDTFRVTVNENEVVETPSFVEIPNLFFPVVQLSETNFLLESETRIIDEQKTKTTYVYDEQNNLIREELDFSGDGNIDRTTIYFYSYDEHGNLIREESDLFGDGNIDRTTIYSYDEQGNLIQTDYSGITENLVYDEQGNLVEINIEYTGDGIADEITTYTYDDSGNLIRYDFDNDNDGNTDETGTRIYNELGNILEESYDGNNDGIVDAIINYTYDEQGNLIQYNYDGNNDGIVDETGTYSYNEQGKLTEENYPGRSITYTYDEQGNLKEGTIDYNGDGIVNETILRTYVRRANNSPVIANEIADFSTTEDSEFNLTIPDDTFVDPDEGDRLLFAATLANGEDLPAWLTFDAETRTFNGTPNNSNVGTLDLEVAVTDNEGETASDRFTLTVENVDDPPIVSNPIADVVVDEDSENTVIDVSNIFSDVDNEDSEIALTVASNSNNLVTASIENNQITLDYQPDRFGTSEITVRGESNGKTVENSFTVNVNSVNDFPFLENSLADAAATSGEYFELTVPENSFSDVDEDSLVYSATIGDADLPAWLSFAADTRTFSGTPEIDAGDLEIEIQASDPSGATASDRFTLSVESQAIDSANLTVYRFFNPSNGVHFYTVDKVERDYVLNNLSNYTFEGESYTAVDPLSGEEVHRFFNSQTGAHLYTTDEVEKDFIAENLNNFNYEGIVFHAHETPVDNSIPVYRFYEPSIGVHFYTPDETEKTFVEENLSNYDFEGIAYYAFPTV